MGDSLSLPRHTFNNLPAEKRDKIVGAAMREFSRQGYQKASINTIVKAAGISKGSLYQYFDNKEALFFFIFDSFTELVKKTVKQVNKQEKEFFGQVRYVLQAGIEFIDQYPEYFQIYLKVLFEQDIPHREKLLAQVRLFSREYFGPLCARAQKQQAIRQDIPLEVVIFILDATLDRFLQSYARSYLDCGLDLTRKKREELFAVVDMILQVLQEGLKERVKIDN
ncbi:MAG: TetR/AcrR family transcriptional regulator [Desulfobulbaceae bacterium]|nr:TetR/AcrR family transcriptional regulator [Desulfobulbaceae bacterium]